MKTKKLMVVNVIALLVSVIITSCTEYSKNSSKTEIDLPTISKTKLEDEAWQMEEKYWDYVKNIDTVAYKTLWHNDFIGYPSFGSGVSNKSKIGVWIPDLHQDTSLTFSYKLFKKAVNAIEDVVIVFYDADEIWSNKENKVVRRETFKFTHTWKKNNDNWVILGGMAAKKDQDVLNNLK